MKRITVETSEEFHHKVKVKATQEGKTISDVIRELLRKWLQENDESLPD